MKKPKFKIKKDKCDFCNKGKKLTYASDEINGELISIKYCDDRIDKGLDKLGYEKY